MYRIKSKKGNNYLISQSVPQVLLLHPIMNYLLKLFEKGVSIGKWIEELKNDENEIEKGIIASKKEIEYYHNYLLFLEKNHYFKDTKKINLTGKEYTPDYVKYKLANTEQVVFEVTEACNLKCRYCGYGDLYTGYNGREKKALNITTAKKFLDYMLDFFNSPIHRRTHKRTVVSFYGGEPLLNMEFIKEMVIYAKSKNVTQSEFYFSMTTNGVLLDKYIDFLVENNFHLLVSLDGNAQHNEYRVFPNGSPAFEVVSRNIKVIREKYPDYFKRSVNFLSVIHRKNSEKHVRAIFEHQYQKTPIMSPLRKEGIRKERIGDFVEMSNRSYLKMNEADVKNQARDRIKILQSPFVTGLRKFFHQYSGFVYQRYDQMLHCSEVTRIVNTGTCNPFEKRTFLTAGGKILPCERISHEYFLGNADEKGVHIDFQKIAEIYNRYYSKLADTCNHCYNSDGCEVCIFSLNLNADRPKCDRFVKENGHTRSLEESLTLVEEIPQFYPRIMKDYKIN